MYYIHICIPLYTIDIEYNLIYRTMCKRVVAEVVEICEFRELRGVIGHGMTVITPIDSTSILPLFYLKKNSSLRCSPLLSYFHIKEKDK